MIILFYSYVSLWIHTQAHKDTLEEFFVQSQGGISQRCFWRAWRFFIMLVGSVVMGSNYMHNYSAKFQLALKLWLTE